MKNTSVSDSLDATASSVQRSRARFAILGLLATGTLINYLDRTVVSIAAPVLIDDLEINPALMGVVFSAFAWSYAAAQVPAGLILDRFGTKLTYMLSVVFWSVFTLLHATATGFASLFGYRLGLGIAEAPCFPANGRVVATWFPQQERALATGVYTVGEYVGLAFLSPLLFWILSSFGWQWLFILAGTMGLTFAIVWWARYSEPSESPSVNRAELDYIAAGGGVADGARSGELSFDWRKIGELLRYRQIWGLCLGQFAAGIARQSRILPDMVSDLFGGGTRHGLDGDRVFRPDAVHCSVGGGPAWRLVVR